MSGGVDSSVAAARLLDQGYEAVGVTLHLWDVPDDGSVRGRCCAPEDQHDARRVADKLGIAHYTFDHREEFARAVVDPFVEAYVRGETPSPCVHCNRAVKFAALFSLAERLGAARVATGHYARTVRHNGTVELHRGRDRSKDQSYFLYSLNAEQLERVLFPLGDATKAEVRAEALARALPGASKGESQELCFVPEGRYDAFVAARASDRLRPGSFADAEGRCLGHHAGVHGFTIGQRKGLGIALGHPAFVVDIDPGRAEVRLGPAEALLHWGVRLAEPLFAQGVSLPCSAEVQVRSRQDPVPATVGIELDRVVVRFSKPVRAIARGQIAVAYEGERVIGGGRIDAVLPALDSASAGSDNRLSGGPA
jgi:tRNA-uridine 2-sulfurtransferase